MPVAPALRAAWRDATLDEFGRLDHAGQLILDDLTRYCSGEQTTMRFDNLGRMDPISSAMQEGRRQVLLRIRNLIFREGPAPADDAPVPLSPVDDMS